MILKSILLIDDDEVTNFINKRVIKKLYPDVEVDIAFNGIDALKKIDERIAQNAPCYDVVLIDISMPHMDGWQFSDALSNQEYAAYHNKNVCMLTSSIFEDDMQRAMEYKLIKGFYSKPLDSEKALEILGK